VKPRGRERFCHCVVTNRGGIGSGLPVSCRPCRRRRPPWLWHLDGPGTATSIAVHGLPGCQPGFPTSFQLVRLVDVGLKLTSP